MPPDGERIEVTCGSLTIAPSFANGGVFGEGMFNPWLSGGLACDASNKRLSRRRKLADKIKIEP